MRNVAALLVAFVLSAVAVEALPRSPHLLHAVVNAVDLERGVVQLKPGNEADPTEVAIVQDRTRLQCDDKPARLSDLKVGQRVTLFWVSEVGKTIATIVNWKSGDFAGKSEHTTTGVKNGQRAHSVLVAACVRCLTLTSNPFLGRYLQSSIGNV